MNRDIKTEVPALLAHERRMPSGHLPALMTVVRPGRRITLRLWPAGVDVLGATLPLAHIVGDWSDGNLTLDYDVQEGPRRILFKDARQLGREYIQATVVSEGPR